MPLFSEFKKELPIFKNDEPHYYAPDGSDIRLGPQFDIMPGNVASATFQPKNASIAVAHSKDAPIAIAEKWFYPQADDLPNFYLWMNDGKGVDEIYEITPGTKFEIPVGTKFQVYNHSEKPVPVMMISYPYWPQDDRANHLNIYGEGPWIAADFGNRAPEHHTYLDHQGKLDLSYKDPFFTQGMSGDDYVRISLASIGQNPDEYKIAGRTWTNYAEQLAGLTREQSDRKILEIASVNITSEMQGQRILPLSEEEKQQVISMQYPAPRPRTNSADRLLPVDLVQVPGV